MAVDQTASVTWEGNLTEGKGKITKTGSGAFGDLDVTWASRTERQAGKTSPEELIAAAHASCFCMALSHGLNGAGTPPQRLEVTAVLTFQPGEGIKSSRLTVKGRVAGIDQAKFAEAVNNAKENCPVSKALKGNVELSADATLES
jgi:osmotically inducible protein OsmC